MEANKKSHPGVPLRLRECNALWLRRKYNYAQCVVSAQGLEVKHL